MASLTIRNIPEDAKRRFRQRAAAHGRSMEEEARQMIVNASREEEKPRRGMWEMLYEASRPGLDLPQVPDTPATHASFDK